MSNTSKNVLRKSISFTDEMVQVLSRMAENHGMSFSAFVREGAANYSSKLSDGKHCVPERFVHPPTTRGGKIEKAHEQDVFKPVIQVKRDDLRHMNRIGHISYHAPSYEFCLQQVHLSQITGLSTEKIHLKQITIILSTQQHVKIQMFKKENCDKQDAVLELPIDEQQVRLVKEFLQIK